jgi:hypothetical protein
MHWELWDTETGNLIGDYDSEAEALAVVRDALRRHGASVAETLALGVEHDEECGDDAALPPVVGGAALAARALGTARDRAAGGAP